MNGLDWIILGAAILAGALVVGLVLALMAFTEPLWNPHDDGFSLEEDEE